MTKMTTLLGKKQLIKIYICIYTIIRLETHQLLSKCENEKHEEVRQQQLRF